MKRRRGLLVSLIVVALLFIGVTLFAQTDIEKHKACPYCGMDRGQYAHSRILVTYDNGSEVGFCSLHCAAVDLGVSIDKTPGMVQVGDYNTKKLIDAEKAFWVVGGSKPGVMSKNAKWAFEKKEDAQAFITANGGNMADLEQSIKASYEDMYADTKMIRERRKMKRAQMQAPASTQHKN